jgi:hypothetical protein
LLHAPPPREEPPTPAVEHDAPLIREEVFLRAIEEAEQVGLERIAEAIKTLL